MTDTREARYAEAIREASRPRPRWDAPTREQAAARAVMAVADGELAESRAVLIPITDLLQELNLARQNLHHAGAMRDAHFARAEAAEARGAALRARIEALADEWDEVLDGPLAEHAIPRDVVTDLRAALASPAEDTTPTEQQAQGGRGQVAWHSTGTHDDQCESEFVTGPMAYTACGCASRRPAPVADPTEQQAQDGASDCCGHVHTPEGCTGHPTPSDLWAGVSPSVCDCDERPAPVADPSGAS